VYPCDRTVLIPRSLAMYPCDRTVLIEDIDNSSIMGKRTPKMANNVTTFTLIVSRRQFGVSYDLTDMVDSTISDDVSV
jgi:hypothetical protein